MLVDHATVTFEHLSGLARDRVVNTFTFAAETDMTSANIAAITTAIEQFFTATPTDGTAVGAPGILLSPTLSRTVKPIVRHYNADGHLAGTSSLGSPVAQQQWTGNLPAPLSGGPMPSEVAIALSFHAAFGTDPEFAGTTRPRSSDRGRVFIGPLVMSSLIVGDDSTTHRPLVKPNVRAALLSNAQSYLQVSGGGLLGLQVWSRKNARVRPVVGFSVDDAFDTQRRRGERATLRQAVGL